MASNSAQWRTIRGTQEVRLNNDALTCKRLSKTPSQSKTAEAADSHFYVVAVGASAGGLDALERFFRGLPESSGPPMW